MPAATIQAEPGWGGWIPLHTWWPLQLEIQVSTPVNGAIIVDVPLSGDNTFVSFRQLVRLMPGAPQRVVISVFAPDPRRTLTIRLVASGHEVAHRDVLLPVARAVEGVVLALTREPAGLEFLSGQTRKIRGAYINERDLPAQWQGYAGIHLVVIRDLDARAVSPDQAQALDQWVTQGGRLLVTGGEPLALVRAPWLLRMLPVVPRGVTEVRSPASLPGVRGPIAWTELSVRGGATRAPEGALWKWGAGAVVVWAFDPFAPEMREWSGRVALWMTAVDAPVQEWVASSDLADAVPSSRPLAGWLETELAALSILYVVSVRVALRHAGRTRRGWVVVPAVAGLFAVILYGFALQARRIGTTIVQASAIEVIPGTGVARMRTFGSLIAPYGGTVDLRAPANGWMQLVDPRPVTFETPSVISGRAPASGVRVDSVQVVPMPVVVHAILDAAGLRAEIDNRSGRDIADAQIFRGGQLYRLPRIGPMLSAPLDPTRWEPFTRPTTPPADFRDRFMQEILARLHREPSSAQVAAWLVGRIEDGRLQMTGRFLRVEADQVLIVPLLETQGTPP